MAAGVMAITAPWASTSVLERMTVMRPLPSSQRCTSPQVGRRLGTTQPPVGQRRHQGHVDADALGGLLRRFDAAAAKAGLDGGAGRR